MLPCATLDIRTDFFDDLLTALMLILICQPVVA